ncbi:hypothetical protein P152DRAFT_515034, partial [Eremomyces bilateralis CBS 781.70]
SRSQSGVLFAVFTVSPSVRSSVRSSTVLFFSSSSIGFGGSRRYQRSTQPKFSASIPRYVFDYGATTHYSKGRSRRT